MNRLEDLIVQLRRRRDAQAGELAALLGVSRPTLSRLMAAAGERVCRMGRGRSTHYALTRTVPALGSRIPVRQVDAAGAIHTHGLIHLLDSDRHWLERDEGRNALFEGLPPFAWDMKPQGYIGRRFPSLYPELGLPPRIVDWNDDHCLVALARRGEDCVGDLIIGDESFDRYLAGAPQAVERAEYPEYAQRSIAGQPGSSAGGEHPKFAVLAEGRHVLVKFASGEETLVTQRWKDLLVCEREALEVIRAAAVPAVRAQLFEIDGIRFLEVERFDRAGTRGRIGTLSLYAVAVHALGYLDNWTRASGDLLGMGWIDAADARNMRWLDTFGQLTGNTDRHFGNLSFFTGTDGSLRLAPAYDMLPMIFAPQDMNLVERRFEPQPPTAASFDVWQDAVRHALSYWERLAGLNELSDSFRELCRGCRVAVRELADRAPRA